jgi:GDPmannose 4,6-dehydratase
MLQQDEADDYVIATGTPHSVQEFVDAAFSHVGLDPAQHVVIDPKFLRPAEVDQLIGDPAKARAKLDWEPEVAFEELVQMMVDADLERLSAGAPSPTRIS